MATAQTRYGLLLLTGDSKTYRLPLTEPVDDLLAFYLPHTPERTLLWAGTYGAKVGYLPTEPEDAALKAALAIVHWRRRGIPDLFLRAAKKAARGKFPKEIAPYLARVTFHRNEPDEVPDFLALAAWCLDRAMRETDFTIRKCALCGVPFLATERSRYCRRQAPGSYKQTCQDVGKVKDYRERRRARREDLQGGSGDGNDHRAQDEAKA